MNELSDPGFSPLAAVKQQPICCLFPLLSSYTLHQTVKFQFSLGLYPPMCVSLEGLNLFLLFSVFFFFELTRLLSGRNGTLCVKKRDSESIIKAHRLYAQRQMVSPFSVCVEDHS